MFSRYFFFYLLLISHVVFAQDFVVDTTFNNKDKGFGYGDKFDGDIEKVKYLKDSKILVSGSFTAYNGKQANGLVRLLEDGTLDETFKMKMSIGSVLGFIVTRKNEYLCFTYNKLFLLDSTGALIPNFKTGEAKLNISGVVSIKDVIELEDSSIVVAGYFNQYNTLNVNNIVLLNPRGEIGSGFVSLGTNSTVLALENAGNNQFYVGGWFTKYNNQVCSYLARIQRDGQMDPEFQIGIGPNSGIGNPTNVSRIKKISDTKLLVGGQFSSFNGFNSQSLVKISSESGSVDQTFKFSSLRYPNDYLSDVFVKNDTLIIASWYVTGVLRVTKTGGIDGRFSFSPGTNYSVSSIDVNNKGKILYGGNFDHFNKISFNKIIQLKSNGSIDPDFLKGSGANNGGVIVITPLKDKRIIIAGNFSVYNGVLSNRIARIFSDGKVDTTFNTGAGFDNSVRSVSVQSDGKLVVGGSFIYFNGIGSSRLVRLNKDGGYDSTFNPSGYYPDQVVYSTAIQKDGKILVGGAFSTINGVTLSRLARLNTDGLVDPSFSCVIQGNSIRSISIQTDDKIIIVGDFTSVNNVSVSNIVRLNVDGSIDQSFKSFSGTNGIVLSSFIQPDGKILIAGSFSTYANQLSYGYARINSNGSLDNSFNTSIGVNDYVYSITYCNSKVVIGGEFTSCNNQTRTHLAVLNSNGTLSTESFQFNFDEFVAVLTPYQQDGLLVGGRFLSVNGVGKNRLFQLMVHNPVLSNVDLKSSTMDSYLFPNPANSVVLISDSTEWELFDINGISMNTGLGYQIDVSNLPKGVYMLRFGGVNHKLVKQ